MRQTAESYQSLEAKGLLKKEDASQAFKLNLFQPHPELRNWVEFYWTVEWNLGQKTFVQKVVTNPTIDLSFENDQATNGNNACLVVTGVVPRSYERTLRGQGEVFAVHFRPGMFRPWWGNSVNGLTGTSERLGYGERPWEAPALVLLPTLLLSPNEQRAALMDSFLLSHRPQPDSVGEDICQLVSLARHEHGLWDTQVLAHRRSVSQRTNQRQFLEYVGVSPKWVIQRYRVQAAIDRLDNERIDQEGKSDLTRLALDLGYYDLAHFSRDFRKVTGYAPDTYRKPTV